MQKIIKGDLKENLKFQGDVIVEGNVAPGVRLEVENGGLQVKGSVGEKVVITQKGGGSGNISMQGVNVGGSVTINNVSSGSIVVSGGNVTINGVNIDQLKNKNAGELSGVVIGGHVGNGASVDSAATFSAASVGDNIRIKAINSITINGAVGKQGSLHAGNGVHTGDVGEGTTIVAGNSIAAAKVAARAILNAGNSIATECVGSDVSLSSGNGVRAPSCKTR